MLKRILDFYPIAVAIVVLSGAVSAQILQNTPALRPFHNQAGNRGFQGGGFPGQTQPGNGFNPNVGPAGPGTLVIPQIMAVKRPLPRRPIQPVFDLKNVNMAEDEVVLGTGARIKELSYKMLEARRNRDNRSAMKHFKEIERTRQRLLLHLREIAPVKKSVAPIPERKTAPDSNDSTPTKTNEQPILPLPRLPGSKNG